MFKISFPNNYEEKKAFFKKHFSHPPSPHTHPHIILFVVCLSLDVNKLNS